MSYVSTFNALNINTLTSGQKLTLAVIASFERAGKAWPSVATIAKRASLSVRSVNYHIAALIKLGYIQRIYRQGRSAITRLFIGGTPANLADTTPAKIADKSVITESVNTIAAPEPTTPEPQNTTDTATAAIVVFTENEQPITPQAITKEMPDVFATDSMVTVSEVTGCHSQAGMPLEARTDPQEPPQEVPATDTLADVPAQAVAALAEVPATQDQAIEADPAMAEWAKIDPMVLLSIMEIRKAKRKAPKPNPVEIKHWYSVALASGWTLPQIVYAMCLRGWSRIDDASWLTGMIPPQMTATGTPAAPAAPKVWTPDPNHTPANASTIQTMKEKIRQMKERWAAEKLAQTAPPMRQ